MGVGGGGVVVLSDDPRSPRRRHRGGTPVLVCSSCVTMLPVAERIIRSIVAAPMASPAPVVMIGGRCPAQQVDYQTG